MAGAFSAIDLSQLPFPAAVEALDFETILAQMLADLRARDPSFTALVESDPAYKILEVAAYRELLLRQRVNEAVKAVMLAYATGADLDQIAANYSVARLLVDPGNPNSIPPAPPTYEDDTSLRRRVQLSFEGFSTAGSAGSYVFHALGADADVLDVAVESQTPGDVTVYVLSRTGTGEASPELVAAVAAALNPDEVRPLTDSVTVQSANIVTYEVTAELTLYPGPDSEVVRQAAEDAVTAYVGQIKRIGLDVSRSGLMKQLHQPGVQDVQLAFPAANVVISSSQAAHCTGIAVTVNPVRDE